MGIGLGNRLLRRYRQKPQEERAKFETQLVEFQIGPWRWLGDLPIGWLFGGNLRILATYYHSDKWNNHWYVQYYENLFRKTRRQPRNVLEIGVGGYDDPRKGGGSLRMWRAFFPNSQIYGIDICDKSPHNDKRIRTFSGSQIDSSFLDQVVSEIGKIDVIVDDGSHENEHVIFTFRKLFPLLAEDGYYIVEDTQTSYWKEYGGNETERNDISTSMGFFKSLVDGLNWEEFRPSCDPDYFDLNIKTIFFAHNLIVIRKGNNRENRPR